MTKVISLLIKIILVLIAICCFYLIIRFVISNKKEQRISRFCVSSTTDNKVSLIEKLENFYNKFVDSLSKYLEDFQIFKDYSKKYDKYLDQSDININKSMYFVANKIIIAVLITSFATVSFLLRNSSISFLQLLIVFLISFYLLDMFLLVHYFLIKRKIENDLFKAVYVMNNAFKSGRSITQAIDLVSIELDGDIATEFKKMYIDLTYGLDLEVVFNRFLERVKLDEIRYMASSIVILNKTGGDIVKVFDSVEKSFYERKKLDNELKSGLALSNLVFKILVCIPIILVIIVYLLDNTYFNIFISSFEGRMCLGLIILIYLLYILAVKKISKLKN